MKHNFAKNWCIHKLMQAIQVLVHGRSAMRMTSSPALVHSEYSISTVFLQYVRLQPHKPNICTHTVL